MENMEKETEGRERREDQKKMDDRVKTECD
jgi:hypothetical protein